jgi:choline-sulfatase
MDRPNILLLFTDMQRADTIGALGNPAIRTPHLDRLVREGTAFTRCFTPSPVCVPARYCLHYGRWPHRTGCTHNGERVADDGRSYVERLGRAGYRTHGIGKMHFEPFDALRGFHSREIQEEMVDDPRRDDYQRHLHASGFDHVLDPHGVRSDWYYLPQVAAMPARLHPTQWIGDRACGFIADARTDGDAPWYLTASFIHPHPPFALPAPWYRLYDSVDMEDPSVPEDWQAHHTRANRIQNRYKCRDQGWDRHLARQTRAAYYGCISFVDYQVGRILAALEASGQLDRTLILFSSDHGELLGDYRCYGKRSMHDAATRVPLLARLPGAFAAGAVCDRPASLVDIAPTVCALGGGAGDDFDGLPLHELAAGRHDREAVFSQHQRGAAAEYLVATRDWSLFWSAADRREYAYHRATDPRQTRLASEAWHPRAFAKLRGRLQRFLAAGGQRDAVEEADGGLRWRLHPAPPDPTADPAGGLLVQRHPWAAAAARIPGYTRDQEV